MTQVDRMDAIAAVHDFKVRVVVATDLASRGLDLANVNLVGHCGALKCFVAGCLRLPSQA